MRKTLNLYTEDRFKRTGQNDEKYNLQNYHGKVKVSVYNVLKALGAIKK